MAKEKDYVNHGGLSRQVIFQATFQATEANLKGLDTAYMNLLLIHRFDKGVPIEEKMETLHDLVTIGKMLYIGASSMWTYPFAMMQSCAETHDWTKFVSIQNYYNLLYREEEREMNKYCDIIEVGPISWAPLCRGILIRASSTERTERSSTDKSRTG